MCPRPAFSILGVTKMNQWRHQNFFSPQELFFFFGFLLSCPACSASWHLVLEVLVVEGEVCLDTLTPPCQPKHVSDTLSLSLSHSRTQTHTQLPSASPDHIYMYIHTYIHTYIAFTPACYINIYICIYIYIYIYYAFTPACQQKDVSGGN
jgi:hypothetical protein